MEETKNQNSDKPDRIQEITIVINGRPKQWVASTISFQQLVTLAYGNFHQDVSTVYTITYKGSSEVKKEGIMVLGSAVKVNHNMIFNVTSTSKS